MLSFAADTVKVVVEKQAESFWESLAKQAYWQLLIVFITAFLASGLTYYFTNRIKRRANLNNSIAEVKALSYLLKQAYANRMNNELCAQFYGAMMRLQADENERQIFAELLKSETASTPAFSSEVSRIYSEIIRNLHIIRQLVIKKSYKEVDRLASELYNRPMPQVSPPIGVSSDQKAQDYLNKGLQRTNQEVNKVKAEMQAIQDALEETELRLI